jgi:hypothetical protein
MSETNKYNRRGFLTALARGAVVGTLGALALSVTTRKENAGETCAREGICRGCPALGGCGLPQALSLKRERK